MARNYFSYTVVKADQTLNEFGDAVLTSLASVTWDAYSLNAAGSATSATVYSARSNGISSTGGVTSYNGVIEFWAEPGEYKISISDPAIRIGNQDIFWSSVSGQEGGIPGTKISNDNALISNQIQDGAIATADIGALQVTEAKLAANSVTTAKIADLQVTGAKIADNVLPLGSVIDWYRVTTGTFVPTGWAVCDGSLWNDIDNHMGVSKAKRTTGNIPNLVGKFTVGARLTVASGGAGGAADGTGSSNGNAYANAPGIGGTGGSNAAIDLAHTHDIPAHGHNSSTLSATGAKAWITTAENNSVSADNGSGSYLTAAANPTTTTNGQHSHYFSGFGGVLTSGNGAVYYATAGVEGWGPVTWTYGTAPDGNHSHTVNHAHTIYQTNHTHGVSGRVGPNLYGDSAFTSDPAIWTAAVTDVRPAHVGLLKIMKVKIV